MPLQDYLKKAGTFLGNRVLNPFDPSGLANPLGGTGGGIAGAEPLNAQAMAIRQSQQGLLARKVAGAANNPPSVSSQPPVLGNALRGTGGLAGGVPAPSQVPVSAATAQLQQEAANLAKYGSANAPTQGIDLNKDTFDYQGSIYRTNPDGSATRVSGTGPETLSSAQTQAPDQTQPALTGEVLQTTPNFVDTYKNIYNQLGLGDIRSQIESTGTQLQDLQNKKIDEISLVNENPWLTEGQRQERVNAVNKRYDMRESNLVNRIQLFQSTFEQGRQEAQFVASQTQQERKDQQAMIERQLAAEQTLKAKGQEVLSVADARTLGVPYGTTVAEAKKLGVTPKPEEKLGAGIVGEYQFYAQQEKVAGRQPLSFNDYQTIDANRKARAGSRGGGSLPRSLSGVSARTKAVYDNPALISNYTPTERGKIIDELASAGVDISRFGLEKVAGGQREQIAKYDDLEREAKNAESLVTRVNTGPLAGRSGSFAQVLGQASPDFTAYKSSISNMNSILLNLRSGAAVSPSEYDRIKGFIPLINEDEKTAAQKIPQFFEAINNAKNNYINRATQSAFQLQQSAQPSGGSSGTTSSGLGYTIVP